ncbi:RNA polymerase III-inhibiting protein maf1 [Dispira simplex]|nr:RNA polymerase III-inhibiting protein maf1 [Dispira simplex]
MKYLDIPDLDLVNAALTFKTSSDSLVCGRLEAYSCKSAGEDKKLYKFFENKFHEDLREASSLSPEDPLSHMISPFGLLTEPASRKVLFYLTATLNMSFPDYDFRLIKPEQFTYEPDVMSVVKSINTTLFATGNTTAVQKYRLWEMVDEIINLNACSVYSYHPDVDSDPFDDYSPIPLSYSEDEAKEGGVELDTEYPMETMEFSDEEPLPPKSKPLWKGKVYRSPVTSE